MTLKMRNLEFLRALCKILVRDMKLLNAKKKSEAKVLLWIECQT
jgi:hypothetical protein